MDPWTFDRLIAEATRPSRRGALRLLAGGLFGGVLAGRWVAPAAAQRPDSDSDGLYDDDETAIYGTDPSAYDTDGDAVGDGEEVYIGTNPLAGEVVVEQIPLPPGCFAVDTSGNCVIADAGSVGDTSGGAGGGPSVICFALGVPCDYDHECCGASAFCCWDGVSLRTECTDVAGYGHVCPL